MHVCSRHFWLNRNPCLDVCGEAEGERERKRERNKEIERKREREREGETEREREKEISAFVKLGMKLWMCV